MRVHWHIDIQLGVHVTKAGEFDLQSDWGGFDSHHLHNYWDNAQGKSDGL